MIGGLSASQDDWIGSKCCVYTHQPSSKVRAADFSITRTSQSFMYVFSYFLCSPFFCPYSMFYWLYGLFRLKLLLKIDPLAFSAMRFDQFVIHSYPLCAVWMARTTEWPLLRRKTEYWHASSCAALKWSSTDALLKWDDQLCEHVFFWFCWMTDHMTTSSHMSPERTARYAPQLSTFWSEESTQIV